MLRRWCLSRNRLRWCGQARSCRCICCCASKIWPNWMRHHAGGAWGHGIWLAWDEDALGWSTYSSGDKRAVLTTHTLKQLIIIIGQNLLDTIQCFRHNFIFEMKNVHVPRGKLLWLHGHQNHISRFYHHGRPWWQTDTPSTLGPHGGVHRLARVSTSRTRFRCDDRGRYFLTKNHHMSTSKTKIDSKSKTFSNN